MQTWGLTDPGNIRQQNQDSYAIVPFARDRVLHDRLRRHGRREVRQCGELVWPWRSSRARYAARRRRA